MDLIFKGIGYLAASGVGVGLIAAIVWQFFKWFGAKWMEAKFAERLADYTHKQNQEIERLRFEIARLLDRATKLSAREFEVLPAAWDLLALAMGSAVQLLHPQRVVINIAAYAPDELKSALDRSPLLEHEKQKVVDIAEDGRNDLFEIYLTQHEHLSAKEAIWKANNYVIANGLFVEPQLRVKMMALIDHLNSALDSFAAWQKNGQLPDQSNGFHKLTTDTDKLYREIESDVSAKLWT